MIGLIGEIIVWFFGFHFFFIYESIFFIEAAWILLFCAFGKGL